MKKTTTIVILSVAALLLIGIAGVYAQGPGNPDGRPFGSHMGGRGMMGGFGGVRFEAAAEALGLEEDALIEALQSGQTLPEIAEAQGVELADLEAALLTATEDHLTSLVESGTITQEQADWMLENMRTNFADADHLSLMFSGMGRGGHCLGWQNR